MLIQTFLYMVHVCKIPKENTQKYKIYKYVQSM